MCLPLRHAIDLRRGLWNRLRPSPVSSEVQPYEMFHSCLRNGQTSQKRIHKNLPHCKWEAWRSPMLISQGASPADGAMLQGSWSSTWKEKRQRDENQTEFISLLSSGGFVLFTVSPNFWLTQCTWRCRTAPTHALIHGTSSYPACRRPSCTPERTPSEALPKRNWSYHNNVLRDKAPYHDECHCCHLHRALKSPEEQTREEA